jgi:hypothetical protein
MCLIFRFQRSALWPISHPALELGSCCVGLLGTCYFALCPFSGARLEICHPAFCCQRVMLVCWLFFNFVTFDFGYSSLVQEMNFMDHYLPYFRQPLNTSLLSTCLPFQALFTESSCGDLLLVLPPFSSVLSAPCPFCCMFLFSSLFIIQFFFFNRAASICPGDYAGLSQG